MGAVFDRLLGFLRFLFLGLFDRRDRPAHATATTIATGVNCTGASATGR
jgi:hypothetical protein